MSLLSTTIDPGSHIATGSQIAEDRYTIGITSLRYFGPGQISVGTGKALLFSTQGQPFIGYEVVSASEPVSLLLIGLGLGGICIARRNSGQLTQQVNAVETLMLEILLIEQKGCRVAARAVCAEFF
jgi:hypothetical protein